jgi:hypothetical protein
LRAKGRVLELCPLMQERIIGRRGSRAERGRFASAFPAARAACGRRLWALLAGALLTGALLAGCSTAGDNPFTVFADPGKYEFYSCDQITAQRKHWSTREQELRTLMTKAEQDTGGVIVNVLAYKADHVAASEELKVLEATARSKNCETPANWRSNSAVR